MAKLNEKKQKPAKRPEEQEAQDKPVMKADEPVKVDEPVEETKGDLVVEDEPTQQK